MPAGKTAHKRVAEMSANSTSVGENGPGPPPVNYGEGESVRKKLLYLLRLSLLKRQILGGGAG